MIRRSTAEDFPRLSGSFGTLDGLDLLPKASGRYLPMLAVGSARQTLQWIARNLDGWVTYFRPIEAQKPRIDMWRSAVETQAHGAFRPFATSMFIDGRRPGRRAVADLPRLSARPPPPAGRARRHGGHGANHVAFNLRHSTRPAGEVLEELAEFVLPRYPSANGWQRGSRRRKPAAGLTKRGIGPRCGVWFGRSTSCRSM